MNLLFTVLVYQALAARELTRMVSIAVAEDTFDPTSEIPAAFASYDPINAELAIAAATFIPLRPVVNLANYPSIVGMFCDRAGEIEVVFSEDQFVKEAFGVWKPKKNLAVLVPHEWRCFGDSMTAFEITSMVDHEFPNPSITLKGSVVSLDTVITSYELEIVNEKDEAQLSSLSKRDLGEHLERLFKKIGRKFKKFLSKLRIPNVKNVTLTQEWNLPLDINYNRKTKKATKESIPFPKMDKITCQNCYATGNANFHITVEGDLLKAIEGYEMELGGNYIANLDLHATLLPAGKSLSYKIPLVSLPLSPLGVPGLFSVGPQFSLNAGLEMSADAEIGITAGFDVSYPFSFKLASSNGLGSAPTLTKTWNPSLNAHKMDVPVSSVDFNANFNAELALGLTVITKPVAQLALDWDSKLGLEVSRCPEDLLNFDLYHEHGLTFGGEALGAKKSYDLWKSDKISIACPFCNKCPSATKRSLVRKRSRSTL